MVFYPALAFFLAVGVIELLAVSRDWIDVQWVAKPLIMLSLIGYYMGAAIRRNEDPRLLRGEERPFGPDDLAEAVRLVQTAEHSIDALMERWNIWKKGEALYPSTKSSSKTATSASCPSARMRCLRSVPSITCAFGLRSHALRAGSSKAS